MWKKPAENIMKRAVVDTNVFVSIILGGILSETLYKDLQEENVRLILSETLLDELLYVLSRPKLRFDKTHSDNVVNFLLKKAEFVTPSETISLCRDPKDNKVLECAAAGNPDFIVTGDEDLLVLEPFRGIPILRPNEFLVRLKS